MSTNTSLSRHNKVILILPQVLWHTLYLLALTVWKNIPVIPRFAETSEILDRTRWFWLMDAPDSLVQNGPLISNLMRWAALAEVLFCSAWLFVFFKNNWRKFSTKVKALYVTVILAGAIVSALFELRMRLAFMDMTEYYFLWQRELSTEILAIVVALFALAGFLLRRYSEDKRTVRNH